MQERSVLVARGHSAQCWSPSQRNRRTRRHGSAGGVADITQADSIPAGIRKFRIETRSRAATHSTETRRHSAPVDFHRRHRTVAPESLHLFHLIRDLRQFTMTSVPLTEISSPRYRWLTRPGLSVMTRHRPDRCRVCGAIVQAIRATDDDGGCVVLRAYPAAFPGTVTCPHQRHDPRTRTPGRRTRRHRATSDARACSQERMRTEPGIEHVGNSGDGLRHNPRRERRAWGTDAAGRHDPDGRDAHPTPCEPGGGSACDQATWRCAACDDRHNVTDV